MSCSHFLPFECFIVKYSITKESCQKNVFYILFNRICYYRETGKHRSVLVTKLVLWCLGCFLSSQTELIGSTVGTSLNTNEVFLVQITIIEVIHKLEPSLSGFSIS